MAENSKNKNASTVKDTSDQGPYWGTPGRTVELIDYIGRWAPMRPLADMMKKYLEDPVLKEFLDMAPPQRTVGQDVSKDQKKQ